MNKCYYQYQYYNINGIKHVLYCGFIYGDKENEEKYYDNFSDFYETIKNDYMYSMWVDTTFFRHRKCVRISDVWAKEQTITEKNFVPIILGKEYKECKPRVEELVRLLTLDQFIEYAKNCEMMGKIDKFIGEEDVNER